MEFKDYYQTLGVARDAAADEIKRSYRRLARKFHPDVSQEADAETRFKEVKEAYEVLKDPDKRSAYDRFGKNWKAGQDFTPPPGWDAGGQFGGGGFSGAGDFSEFFESLFGGAGRRHAWAGPGRARARGEHIEARVSVSIDDAFNGATRAITLTSPASGRSRTLNVKIPQGVTEGQRIRLAGQGEAGPPGKPPGDLLLEVAFEPHRLYRTAGRDLHLDLPVTPWESALGRTVTVPTPGGRVDLKIPAGSQGGRRLRLKGRGLPGQPPGDLYVTLEVVTPRPETDAARELYERMEREMPFDPRAGLGA